MSEETPVPVEGSSEFLLYQTEGGETRVQVRLFEGTVWLTQRLISELYQKSVKTINGHIKNIYEEGELDPRATIRKFRIVQQEGDRRVERLVDFYSLDMILAVGYRVRSHRGTQFRQWATKQLREYVVKGFVLDDERLKEAGGIGGDYFDELLERIRDIRASERRFYQKITDIYATSIDYDPKHPMTLEFFKTVQNKMHWAIHGHTAAETIYLRADAGKPHMGLTTWKDGPKGGVRKTDVTVAKNYLTQEELSNLNLIVNQYLDFAEFQARQRREMRMEDWIRKLDGFLQLNDRSILENAGKISAEKARQKALKEFEHYEAQRRIREATEPTSDFDLMVENIRYLSDGKDDT
ncbi:virulence RhuM family protein [Methanoculleus sp. FWC-SCC1]|uniref:Virulence RhuM family protein n=1 Tax=Methanoculleus frigidifontis TaxID=2584085 RepID=A0ABT8MCK4_9EURY|nr:virulence RhuM family protein [Methanoculleus sp. FWC-SCC1]MDN7025677.1 virulence RhuM family protein [Methanoculleus sp. FWC-SCC1]